jgi:prevent-host-death family protein
MKRLSEQVSLEKTLEEITISEFRERPGEVLHCVELGKTFVITKIGHPVAVLSKVPGETLSKKINRDGTEKYIL